MPHNFRDFIPWSIGGLPTMTLHDLFTLFNLPIRTSRHDMTQLHYRYFRNKHQGTIHKLYKWIHSKVTNISTIITAPEKIIEESTTWLTNPTKQFVEIVTTGETFFHPHASGFWSLKMHKFTNHFCLVYWWLHA